jgi:hypothetical protein
MTLPARLIAGLLGTWLTFAPVHAQEPAIKVAERQTLSAAQVYRTGSALRNPAHKLTLTLVYFTGGWPRNAVVRAAGSAAKLLEQCGVGLRQVELVRVDAPQRYHYFDTPASRELARTLQLSKPTVYFVTDTRQQPGFDAEAIGRGNSATRPELVDSVWVTRGTRDVGIAIAHELVHVLANSGDHVDVADNLMRDETSTDNIELTPAQCDQLRTVGAKNGLLQTPTGQPVN